MYSYFIGKQKGAKILLLNPILFVFLLNEFYLFDNADQVFSNHLSKSAPFSPS